MGDGTIVFNPEVNAEQEIDNITEFLKHQEDLSPMDRAVAALKKFQQGTGGIANFDNFMADMLLKLVRMN